MKFWSDSKVQQKLTATRPLMRLSLMCLQSCMPDHRDNITNFVTDTDLNKIKAKAAAKVVDEIETLLDSLYCCAGARHVECASHPEAPSKSDDEVHPQDTR